MIRSHLVCKELAGFGAHEYAVTAFEAGIYAPAWIERT